MLSPRFRTCLVGAAILAATVSVVGVDSAAADVDCLSKISPITAGAAATLGYSVKAVRGEDVRNCNFLHSPIKIVDVNNTRAPVHPTVGVSFQNPTPAAFSAIVRSERKLARSHTGLLPCPGSALSPLLFTIRWTATPA